MQTFLLPFQRPRLMQWIGWPAGQRKRWQICRRWERVPFFYGYQPGKLGVTFLTFHAIYHHNFLCSYQRQKPYLKWLDQEKWHIGESGLDNAILPDGFTEEDMSRWMAKDVLDYL